MALLTAALCILTGALLHGRSSTSTLAGGLTAAVVLLGLFVTQQRRRAHPIFEPAVFMRPAMAGIAVLLMALSVAYWSILVYLPLFLTAAYGWPSQIAGFALLTATAPMLIVPPLGGTILNRIGWRWHFAGAFAGIAVGNASFLAALSAHGPAPPLPVIGFGMIAAGVGAALAHPQLSGAVVALVPAGQAGMASAVMVVLRQAGFAAGIAGLGALLGSAEQTAGYVRPFAAAAIVSFVGLLAAVILLPARAPRMAG
jgi:predicted MFS family arabinose efflux permease